MITIKIGVSSMVRSPRADLIENGHVGRQLSGAILRLSIDQGGGSGGVATALLVLLFEAFFIELF